MEEKKKVLECKEVEPRKIDDHWPEWAVRNVWPLVKNNTTLSEYLPTEEMRYGRYVDKVFFRGVAFTVIPNWADAYYDAVVKKREGEEPIKKRLKAKKVKPTPAMLEKLEKYPYVSKCM